MGSLFRPFEGMGLILYSEVGCSGSELKVQDKEVNLAKSGLKFDVKSARVEGNPWVLYSEERYQKFLAFLEEGDYTDFTLLGLPASAKVASAKVKSLSAGFPHITLFNAAHFKDEPLQNGSHPNGVNGHALDPSVSWSNGDQKIGCVAAGIGGVWALTRDGSVMMREGAVLGGSASGWTTGLGKMKSLSIGTETVWGLNHVDEVFVRIGVSANDPKGKEWTKVDGTMSQISVGPTGVCWAVDKGDAVWRRLGAKTTNALGTKWQSVTGKLRQVSVGESGVWGITPSNEVMYGDGTFGLPGEAGGSGSWSKVDGMMVWIAVGLDIVWGVSANGDLWYRA